jgi:quercetin dioxygenase-like cupin family protein
MGERFIARHSGEGDALWMLGGLYEVKATADETDGTATVMEFTIPVGMGPPPHVHDCAEFVYVLEGTGTWHVDGQQVEGRPGSMFYFPAGVEETFEPTSTLRILLLYTPGGIDRFFKEFGEPADRREAPPAPEGPPDIERLTEIATRYGLEVHVPQQV